jgi:hypothetical protein
MLLFNLITQRNLKRPSADGAETWAAIKYGKARRIGDAEATAVLDQNSKIFAIR